MMKSQHIELQQMTDDLENERKQRENLEEKFKQLNEQLISKDLFVQHRTFSSSYYYLFDFLSFLEKIFD